MSGRLVKLMTIFLVSSAECAELLNATFHATGNKTVQAHSESIGNSSGLSMSPRSFQGLDISWKNFKFIAQLILRGSDKKSYFHCTGFMVTRQMMMTSSNCLREWDGGIESLTVRIATDIGYKDGSTDGSTWRVSGVYRHPGFTDRRELVDLALIRTDLPIPADRGMEPIGLPEPGDADKMIDDDFTQLTTISMGASFGKDVGFKLKMNHVKLWKDRCIRDWLIQIDPIHQLCTRSNEFRYCIGDLGSPIFMDSARGLVIVAMVSETLYYCSKGEYSKNEVAIASRISSDMPWILMKINTFTSNHGLEKLLRKWNDVPYPDDVQHDESMDIEGNPDDYKNT